MGKQLLFGTANKMRNTSVYMGFRLPCDIRVFWKCKLSAIPDPWLVCAHFVLPGYRGRQIWRSTWSSWWSRMSGWSRSWRHARHCRLPPRTPQQPPPAPPAPTARCVYTVLNTLCWSNTQRLSPEQTNTLWMVPVVTIVYIFIMTNCTFHN